MPLKEIFKTITEMFEHEKADYAVIGAFALYAYGYVRATNDIDFVTRIEFQNKAVRHLESPGCKTTYRSEAFSNHVHPIGSMRVDFMYLEQDTADTIFSKVERKVLFEGLKIPVVSAEHLVAMKLFAAKHNERRRLKDLADIKEIVSTVDIDTKTVKNYFIKFGLESYYNEIESNTNES